MSNNPVSFRVEPNSSALRLMARLSDRAGFGQAIARGLDMENFALVAAIKAKINGSPVRGLRGSQVLHRRTGRLSTSISNSGAIVESGKDGFLVKSAVGSGVGSGSNAVRYAAIHEYGGIINIPARQRKGVIKTRQKDYRGKTVYKSRKTGRRVSVQAAMTKAYSITMPERSYIRSTYRERAARYTRRLSQIANQFVRGGSTT